MTGQRILVTGGSGFVGTNLVSSLMRHGSLVLSVDINEPVCADHADNYRRLDILDPSALREVVEEFRPDHVIHAAARTDLDGKAISDYAANTEGVRNLIAPLSETDSVRRCVFISTKLVCRNDYVPSSFDDYCPDTVYGESKVEGEKIVKQSGALNFEWCLARLTGIWGPWFRQPYRRFFEMISRSSYRHPGGTDAPKSFGYVGNTVFQIQRLLDAQAEQIDRRTFYLADYQPMIIREWANMISQKLHKRDVRTIAGPLMRIAALAGDLMTLCGCKHPPVTSFRLRNMRADTSGISLDDIRKLADPLPYTIEAGVDETIDWMRQQGIIEC